MKRINFVVAMESETPDVPAVPAADTPAAPVDAPAADPAPAEPVVAETPAEPAAAAPAAEVPAETPAEAPAETPAEVPAEVPAEAPVVDAEAAPAADPVAEVPAEAPVDAPAADAPVDTPVDVPAEAAAEVPAADGEAAPASAEVPGADAVVPDEDEVDESDDTVGTDALLADQEVEANFDELETTSAVMESLSMYASNIAYLIESNKCSLETADLINFGIQQSMNRLGEQGPTISLESGTDIVEQHRVALEGIRDAWKRLAQYFVVATKHSYMIFFDALRSNTGLVESYDKKVTAAEAEYKTDKGGWKDANHKGSLVELWYHFATDKGQAKDVVGAISTDLELSKYILDTYPSELITLLGKLTSIARSSKATTLKDAIVFAKRVEALQHPADVFRKNYVTDGKPYLSVTGLEMTQGTARNPIAIGEKAMTKLAELATPRAVVEAWSAKHAAVKVGTYAATMAPISAVVSSTVPGTAALPT